MDADEGIGVRSGVYIAPLMAQIRMRLLSEAADPSSSPRTPEQVASDFNGYLDGWAHAARHIGESDLDRIATDINAALCEPDISEAAIIVIARLETKIPALARTTGLDCALERLHAEEAPLAAVLDAYRRAGLPPSDAWERWRQRATDPGIQRRFLPWGVEPPERTAPGTEIAPGVEMLPPVRRP